MDVKTALENIKETEAQVRTLIENAKKEAQVIILEAQQKQDRMIKDSEQLAKIDADKAKNNTQSEIEQEILRMRKIAQEEIQALRTCAKNRMEHALHFIEGKLD